ncbi:hypothetical protein B0H16DRAFT_1534744 [Mycena metata]|uniref:Uncharacterized protein n=1 Tax=Mycena metata TaxID=1033252 RepID=A0AAD7J8B6_9AGAR|nr:hypothetical protein B0H16DRAFT_1534744 [Mycena metata]
MPCHTQIPSAQRPLRMLRLPPCASHAESRSFPPKSWILLHPRLSSTRHLSLGPPLLRKSPMTSPSRRPHPHRRKDASRIYAAPSLTTNRSLTRLPQHGLITRMVQCLLSSLTRVSRPHPAPRRPRIVVQSTPAPPLLHFYIVPRSPPRPAFHPSLRVLFSKNIAHQSKSRPPPVPQRTRCFVPLPSLLALPPSRAPFCKNIARRSRSSPASPRHLIYPP